jgi:hypothetical protein
MAERVTLERRLDGISKKLSKANASEPTGIQADERGHKVKLNAIDNAGAGDTDSGEQLDGIYVRCDMIDAVFETISLVAASSTGVAASTAAEVSCGPCTNSGGSSSSSGSGSGIGSGSGSGSGSTSAAAATATATGLSPRRDGAVLDLTGDDSDSDSDDDHVGSSYFGATNGFRSSPGSGHSSASPHIEESDVCAVSGSTDASHVPS